MLLTPPTQKTLAQEQGLPETGARHTTSHNVPLKAVETSLIRRAVDQTQGNVMETAHALGINRATVHRKIGRR